MRGSRAQVKHHCFKIVKHHALGHALVRYLIALGNVIEMLERVDCGGFGSDLSFLSANVSERWHLPDWRDHMARLRKPSSHLPMAEVILATQLWRNF